MRKLASLLIGLSVGLSASMALATPVIRPGTGTKGEDLRPVVTPLQTRVEGRFIGGGGGSITEQTCRHPYGVQMDVTPSGVRRFGLRCMDDTESVFWDLALVGSPGTALSSLECQPGYEIAGFFGRSGLFIDALGLLCRPLDPAKRILQDRTVVYGGAGGGDFRWECPLSYHVGTVRVGSGLAIDSLQILCDHD